MAAADAAGAEERRRWPGESTLTGGRRRNGGCASEPFIDVVPRDTSQSTSFRRDHVLHTAHTLVSTYPTPPTVSNPRMLCPRCICEKKMLFPRPQGSKKSHYFTRLPRSEGHFPLPPESAEGSFTHASLPVLASEAGRDVFHLLEGFCEVRSRLVIARDAGGEHLSS